MDGVHDLGGMHGFGPVPIEIDEPLFHEPWEGRVWSMLRAVMGATTIDHFRYTIEQMPPAEYLASSYYDRWLWAVEHLAAEQGILDSPDAPARSGAAVAGATAVGREVPTRRSRPRPQPGHERPHPGAAVPPPARGHRRAGRLRLAQPHAKSAATGTYGEPELVYTVAFAGTDLFGPAADHTLTADLGESDLEEPAS